MHTLRVNNFTFLFKHHYTAYYEVTRTSACVFKRFESAPQRRRRRPIARDKSRAGVYITTPGYENQIYTNSMYICTYIGCAIVYHVNIE